MAMTAPLLTVVIPTYNRAGVLGRCLAALQAQTCSHDAFCVVVADDGSADDTAAVVQRASAQFPIEYLKQPNSGANAARNRAISVAQTPLLLFINDDVLPHPDMIGFHLAAHERNGDDRVAVLGRVTVSPELPPSRLAPLHLDRAFAALGDRREHDWKAFFTCNVSVKKSLLERAGVFEERMRYHEDLELSERLSHAGLRIVYEPRALGYHHHYLAEDEFFQIAAREAKALAVWGRISPHLAPVLAQFGYEPGFAQPKRVKQTLAGLLINHATLPVWKGIARRLPSSLERLSLAVYSQMYQQVRARHLRWELQG